MGAEVPEQPGLSCREMQQTTVGGCRHAGGSLEQGKSISFSNLTDKLHKVGAYYKIGILPIGWQQEDVGMGNEQNKQFDPGG